MLQRLPYLLDHPVPAAYRNLLAVVVLKALVAAVVRDNRTLRLIPVRELLVLLTQAWRQWALSNYYLLMLRTLDLGWSLPLDVGE